MEERRIRTKPFTLDRDHFARFQLRQLRPRVLRNTLPLLAIAAAILVALLRVPWPLALLGAGGAFAFGLAVQGPMLRRMLDKPRFDVAFTERIAEFTPDRYWYQDEAGEMASLPLHDFQTAYQEEGYYVLSMGPGQSVLIPVDAFEDEKDRVELRGYLSEAGVGVEGF